MNTFVCGVCGHIYFGDDSPAQCPICHVPRENFSANPDIIKTPADPNNFSEGEKKHIPDITVSKQGDTASVTIDIGEIPHVMTPEHFIAFIDVYLDNKVVFRGTLKPDLAKASLVIPVKLAGAKEIKVVENCNVHGYWMERGEL